MSDPIDSVIVECELPDPPEKVWRALTEPNLVAEWLTDEAEPVERHVLLEEPHRLLRYAWRDGRDVESLVTFELERTSTGGTILRVVHTGISEAVDAPVCMLKAA
ncbi:MAG: SRPBCC domain-containing protein [Gammaproteobacteria bacterium]